MVCVTFILKYNLFKSSYLTLITITLQAPVLYFEGFLRNPLSPNVILRG